MLIIPELIIPSDKVNLSHLRNTSGGCARTHACNAIPPGFLASFINQSGDGVNYPATVAAAEAILGVGSVRPHRLAYWEAIKHHAFAKSSNSLRGSSAEISESYLHCTTPIEAMKTSGRCIEGVPSVDAFLHPFAPAAPSALHAPMIAESSCPLFRGFKPIYPIIVSESEFAEKDFDFRVYSTLKSLEFLLNKIDQFDNMNAMIEKPEAIIMVLGEETYKKYTAIQLDAVTDSETVDQNRLIDSYSDSLGMLFNSHYSDIQFHYIDADSLVVPETLSEGFDLLASNAFKVLSEHILKMSNGLIENTVAHERFSFDMIAQAGAEGLNDAPQRIDQALEFAGLAIKSDFIGYANALHFLKYLDASNTTSVA